MSQEGQQAGNLTQGHGRIEHRSIVTTTVLSDRDLWPGLQQAYKIERVIIEKNSGKERREEEYGVTSAGRYRVDAEKMLEINRGHGG